MTKTTKQLPLVVVYTYGLYTPEEDFPEVLKHCKKLLKEAKLISLSEKKYIAASDGGESLDVDITTQNFPGVSYDMGWAMLKTHGVYLKIYPMVVGHRSFYPGRSFDKDFPDEEYVTTLVLFRFRNPHDERYGDSGEWMKEVFAALPYKNILLEKTEEY